MRSIHAELSYVRTQALCRGYSWCVFRTHVTIYAERRERARRICLSCGDVAVNFVCFMYLTIIITPNYLILENGLFRPIMRRCFVSVSYKLKIIKLKIFFFATVEFFSGAPRFIDYSPLYKIIDLRVEKDRDVSRRFRFYPMLWTQDP